MKFGNSLCAFAVSLSRRENLIIKGWPRHLEKPCSLTCFSEGEVVVYTGRLGPGWLHVL